MTGTSGSTSTRAQWLRRLALRRRDRIAFVFSGGGPLGALQVGALKALSERGIRPELSIGCSVGALNASFVAFDPSPAGIDNLEQIWLTLKDTDLFPGARFKATWARFLARGNRVFDNSGIRRMVERRLGRARFEDAQIPLAVVATDLETGEEKVFSSGELTDALLASTAMPGIYPPVEIDGRLYIDGGVANNVPLAPAVQMGARTLYVFNSSSHSLQRHPLVRPMDYLLHAFSLARAQRLPLDTRYYGGKVRIVMLPQVKLDYYVPFASMDYTRRLIDAAYGETRRFLSGDLPAVVEEAAGGAVEAIVPEDETEG